MVAPKLVSRADRWNGIAPTGGVGRGSSVPSSDRVLSICIVLLSVRSISHTFIWHLLEQFCKVGHLLLSPTPQAKEIVVRLVANGNRVRAILSDLLFP